MTTLDYPDWAQPVAQIEQVRTLFQSDTINLPGGSTGNLDTSAVQTLIGSFTPGNLPLSSTLSLAFDWDNGPGAIFADTITCWDSMSALFGGGCTFRIPVKGTTCNVFWGSTDPTDRTGSLTILGSNRAEPGPTLAQDAANQGTLLASQPTISVAAHSQIQFNVGPVARAVSLNGWAAVAGGRIVLAGRNPTGGGFVTADYLLYEPAGQFINIPEFPAGFTALELILQNTTGAAMNMEASLWDAS